MQDGRTGWKEYLENSENKEGARERGETNIIRADGLFRGY